MKCVGVVVLMLMSLTALCHDKDSTSMEVRRMESKTERKLEREKARIERQHEKMEKKMHGRSVTQRKTDRRVLVFLTISAAILVKALSPGVE